MALKQLVEQGMEMARRALTGEAPEENSLPSRIARVQRLYDMAGSTLSALHRQWYEDLLWMLGEHYHEYEPRVGRFIVRPDRGYIPRATSNLILDAVERSVSFLVKSLVKGHCVPEDASTVSYRAALNADRVNDRLWKDDRMDLKLRIAALWAVTTGNGMFLSGLDSVNKRTLEIPRTRTETVTDPDTGEEMEVEVPMVGQDGQPATDSVPLSDVCSEPINPMEIVVDPHAREPWGIRYFLHHRIEDIDALADQYGSDVKDRVKPDADASMAQMYQHKLQDLVTRTSGVGGAYYGLVSSMGDAKVENAAVVKSFYRFPCSAAPEGEMLVLAGKEVLHDGSYEYTSEDGDYRSNLHWFRWHVAPGSPWGFGEVRNLRDPQRRINGMLTQAGLARKTMGNPAWLAAKGAGFDAEGTSRPGKVYLWTPKPRMTPPQRLDPKEVPAGHWKELEVTENHFDRISGMNDILRGENPPGVDAGVSLELLSERASGRFSPAIEEAREVTRELQEFRLSLVRLSPAWIHGKRLLIRDEDGAPEVMELSAMDIPANPQIELEETPVPLWSTAAKRQNATNGLTLGLIDLTVAGNRRKMRDILGISDFEDPASSDVKLAEFENQQLMKGKAVETREFEDPEIHLKVHRRMLLRPDYDELPTRTQSVIEDHYRATMEKVKQVNADKEAAAAPIDVPPPGMPGPGGPMPGPMPGPGGLPEPQPEPQEAMQ